MAYNDRIIGIDAAGKTIISHNGITFATKDKSVIAMAERGSYAAAAKRYVGKSSTARALRKANREATKPIYKNVASSLYNKIFKQKDKGQLKTDKQSLADFRKLYRKTIQETEKYIDQAVKDTVGIADNIDKLPGDLKTRVDDIISEETEKAYHEKGQVENADISRISNRITDMIEDYMLTEDISPEDQKRLDEVLGTLEEVTEVSELPTV